METENDMKTLLKTELQSKISIGHVSKIFEGPDGKPLTVVDDVSLDLRPGRFIGLIGPSGCGKSTLLNIIANLETLSKGEIRIDGMLLNEHPDLRRRLSYVFQTPRLLNWRRVKDNIIFALKANGNVPKEEWDARVKKYLTMVGLDDFANSFPLQLSGGMQQRVGIARALAIEPDILLMDEPFSMLDEITAKKLREDLTDIWLKEEAELGKRRTIIFVTHDIGEAVYLCDDIYMLTRRPAKLFHYEEVTVPRPRGYFDPEVLQIQSDLTKLFYEKAFG
jgi:NitT/TauT family transport system ATP-binding protein